MTSSSQRWRGALMVEQRSIASSWENLWVLQVSQWVWWSRFPWGYIAVWRVWIRVLTQGMLGLEDRLRGGQRQDGEVSATWWQNNFRCFFIGKVINTGCESMMMPLYMVATLKIWFWGSNVDDIAVVLLLMVSLSKGDDIVVIFPHLCFFMKALVILTNFVFSKWSLIEMHFLCLVIKP